MDQLVTDTDLVQADRPVIRIQKRKSARGRSDEDFVITTGITIVPITNSDEGGTNQREDVAYRYLIACGSGTWTDDLEDDWPVATWEQAIRQRYQQSRIGVTGLTSGCEIATTCKPGKLPDWAKLEDNVDATFLQLAVWIRETRREDS
jgi:hypothetical protein